MFRRGSLFVDRQSQCLPLDTGRLDGTTWGLWQFMRLNADPWSATLLTNARYLADSFHVNVGHVRRMQQQLRCERLVIYPSDQAHGLKTYWFSSFPMASDDGSQRVTRSWPVIVRLLMRHKRRDRLYALIAEPKSHPRNEQFSELFSELFSEGFNERFSEPFSDDEAHKTLWKTCDIIACTLLETCGATWLDSYPDVFSRKVSDRRVIKQGSKSAS